MSGHTEDPFSPDRVDRFDVMNVHDTYARWPDLARQGFDSKVGPLGVERRKVYVLGLGGSAAAGDFLAGWLWSRHSIEAEVCKGVLPIHDLRGTLAIACSASGETEETVSMMKTALEKGAKVVSTSSGGMMASESQRLGIPHVKMPEVFAPRFMLPFMVFSCLSVVESALSLGSESEVEEAIERMRQTKVRIGKDSPTSQNPSKQVAAKLLRKTPAIYATRATRGAGIRFKNSVNENAKKHSTYDEIPELLHNEVEAWEEPGTAFAPVVLRDVSEGPRETRLIDAFVSMLASKGKEPLEFRGEGDSSLARLVSMVYELDLATYYMAIGLGKDPFPITLITELKKLA